MMSFCAMISPFQSLTALRGLFPPLQVRLRSIFVDHIPSPKNTELGRRPQRMLLMPRLQRSQWETEQGAAWRTAGPRVGVQVL